MCDHFPGSCLIDGRHEGGHDFDDLIDPCVEFTCPNCQRDLAPYETKHVDEIQSTSLPRWPHRATVVQRTEHRYECACGTKITVTEPLPGLVQTRQDAVVKD